MQIILTRHLVLNDIPSSLYDTLVQNLRIENPKWIENAVQLYRA